MAALLAAAPSSILAQEQTRTLSLGWARLPGAESCIGGRELALAIEQRLGRAAFVSPSQADVQIEGRIELVPAAHEGADPSFRAHLALTRADGEVVGSRDLEAQGASCRKLDDQIALVIALLIDPDAVLSPRPSAPPRIVVERVFVPTPPPPPEREPWREGIMLGAVLAPGLLPGAPLGLSLRGEIIPPSFIPIELGGAVFLQQTVAPAGASSPSSKGAVLSLSYAMFGVCPLAWRSGGTHLEGCLDLQVGAMRAVGFGFSSGSGVGQDQVMVQGSAVGRLTRRLVGPVEVGLGVGIAVPFRPARVLFTGGSGGQQELFRSSAAAALLDVAVGVGFP